MSFVAAAVGGGALLGSAYAGRQARKGAENAADTQAAAAREGMQILREDLSQYNQLGLGAAPLLMGSVYGVDPYEFLPGSVTNPAGAPTQGGADNMLNRAGGGAMARAINGALSGMQMQSASNDPNVPAGPETRYRLTPFAQPDPNEVLNNPFFKALADQQMNAQLNERSALGLAGSGGTQDSLMRNLLLLGNDFQQQNLQNKMAQNQQRFNQLFGITGIGQASAAQTGAAGMNTANAIGQLNSVSPLARAQERSNLVGNLFQLGGMAVGSGMFRRGGGMNLFSVGSGSTVPNYTPGGGVQFNAGNW